MPAGARCAAHANSENGIAELIARNEDERQPVLAREVRAAAPQHRQQDQCAQRQPHFHERQRAELARRHAHEQKRCAPDGAEHRQLERRQPARDRGAADRATAVAGASAWDMRQTSWAARRSNVPRQDASGRASAAWAALPNLCERLTQILARTSARDTNLAAGCVIFSVIHGSASAYFLRQSQISLVSHADPPHRAACLRCVRGGGPPPELRACRRRAASDRERRQSSRPAAGNHARRDALSTARAWRGPHCAGSRAG